MWMGVSVVCKCVYTVVECVCKLRWCSHGVSLHIPLSGSGQCRPVPVSSANCSGGCARVE